MRRRRIQDKTKRINEKLARLSAPLYLDIFPTSKNTSLASWRAKTTEPTRANLINPKWLKIIQHTVKDPEPWIKSKVSPLQPWVMGLNCENNLSTCGIRLRKPSLDTAMVGVLCTGLPLRRHNAQSNYNNDFPVVLYQSM